MHNVWNELAYEWQLRNFLPYTNNYDLRRNRVINRNIYTNPEFDAFLIRYRSNIMNRHELIQGALEKIRTLQRLIREELHD